MFFFFTCARLGNESPLRGPFIPLNLAIENLTVVLFLPLLLIFLVSFNFISPKVLCVVCISVLRVILNTPTNSKSYIFFKCQLSPIF